MSLKVIPICVLLWVMSVSVSGQTASNETDITKGPPPYDKPWVPGWGWFGNGNKSGWKVRHERLVNMTREHQKDVKMVFLGDSKMDGWNNKGEGIDVWNEFYAKRGGFNYGIGGDSTRQVLWRIENGEMDGLEPKIVVFTIGGNNFYNDFNKGEMIIFNKT